MMRQVAITPVGKSRLPKKMLGAYRHSTNEHRALFNATYERLTEAGLDFYPTNCPDLRARHPQNDIVFLVLQFKEVSGTLIQLRVESVPPTLWQTASVRPHRVAHHDPKSRARWALYYRREFAMLDAIVSIVAAVASIRPAWGNW